MNGFAGNASPVKPARVMLFVLALVLIAGTPLWSQEPQRPEFVNELLALLQKEGWTAEELRALAAQNVPWEDAAGAEPEVVALALELARSEDQELEPMTQALMAIDLAQAAMEMESLGMGELTIAVTALQGVREILGDVRAFRLGEIEGNLGEAIRTRMRERVATAARAQAQERIQSRVQEAKANRPEGLVPDFAPGGLPGSGSGWSPWR